MVYQQGDVLLKKIEKIPAGSKPVKRRERGYVLAEGEVTGHAHVVEDEIVLVEKDGVLYMGTKGDTIVKHEEHHHITVPAGDYQIGIVQEYDHFAEEAKNVRD